METSDPQNAPDKRRKASFLLAYVSLLAAAVLAALYLHDRVLSPPPRRSGPLLTAPPPQSEPAEGPLRPGDLLKDPLESSGLRALRGDPGDVPPPPGSLRLSAVQREAIGRIEQQARYDWAGTPEDAAGHYLREFARRGYQVLSDRREDAGRRTILFRKGTFAANLVLRNAPRDGKMVSVLLIVSRPEGP